MVCQSKTLNNFQRYSISCFGEIFDKNLGRVINQQLNSDGYSIITLRSDNGVRKTFSVHRLVALIYVPNPENKPTVNHKDGVKTNNHFSNLEWATRSEQTQHAWDNGLISDLEKRKLGIRDKQGKPVVCVTTGEVFRSIGEAAEVKGLKKSNLSAVCRGVVGFKSAGTLPDGTKLIWRFYEL